MKAQPAVSNKYLNRRWQQQNYRRHKSNLAKIKSQNGCLQYDKLDMKTRDVWENDLEGFSGNLS